VPYWTVLVSHVELVGLKKPLVYRVRLESRSRLLPVVCGTAFFTSYWAPQTFVMAASSARADTGMETLWC